MGDCLCSEDTAQGLAVTKRLVGGSGADRSSCNRTSCNTSSTECLVGPNELSGKLSGKSVRSLAGITRAWASRGQFLAFSTECQTECRTEYQTECRTERRAECFREATMALQVLKIWTRTSAIKISAPSLMHVLCVSSKPGPILGRVLSKSS